MVRSTEGLQHSTCKTHTLYFKNLSKKSLKLKLNTILSTTRSKIIKYTEKLDGMINLKSLQHTATDT